MVAVEGGRLGRGGVDEEEADADERGDLDGLEQEVLQEGRPEPTALTLDVPSSMPHAVFAMRSSKQWR